MKKDGCMCELHYWLRMCVGVPHSASRSHDRCHTSSQVYSNIVAHCVSRR